MTNTRLRCVRCERPQPACICRWIRPLDNDAVELLILQHPREAREAKNSAALLRLSLSRCRVIVGETFPPETLQPLDGTALLYPVGAGAADAAAAVRPITRLILLDATWRKSRKLLHLNPWLLALPRLALVDPPASRYGALRKAQAPHQLSTLEAGVRALQQLEPGRSQRFEPLLQAFDGFVGQHEAHHYNPPPFIAHENPRV